MMKGIALTLATTFGVGYVPFAPGTFVRSPAWRYGPFWVAGRAAVVIVASPPGVSGSVAEAHYAKTDPSYVVLDEALRC